MGEHKSKLTHHSSFLSFVHSVSSNVRSGHGVAAPHHTHWHQSAESLPDLVGITCGETQTHTKADRSLTFRVSGRVMH